MILRSCGGNCPVHCRIFNSTPGFYLLDAGITAPASWWQSKNDFRFCQMFWMGCGAGGREGVCMAKLPPGKKHCSRGNTKSTNLTFQNKYAWSLLIFLKILVFWKQKLVKTYRVFCVFHLTLILYPEIMTSKLLNWMKWWKGARKGGNFRNKISTSILKFYSVTCICCPYKSSLLY